MAVLVLAQQLLGALVAEVVQVLRGLAEQQLLVVTEEQRSLTPQF
jgi:hypothetical protein